MIHSTYISHGQVASPEESRSLTQPLDCRLLPKHFFCEIRPDSTKDDTRTEPKRIESALPQACPCGGWLLLQVRSSLYEYILYIFSNDRATIHLRYCSQFAYDALLDNQESRTGMQLYVRLDSLPSLPQVSIHIIGATQRLRLVQCCPFS